MQLFPYFCGKDCGGDACPLMAKFEGVRIVGMEHSHYAGQWITPCGKGMRAHADHYSSKRLTSPLIRTGARGSGQFREASWDEALSLIATTLSRIRGESGPESVMSISSAGSTGALHNTEVLTMRYFNVLGGCVGLSGNYSSNAANYAIGKMFGTSAVNSGFDAATLTFSKLIVLWGANPLEARLGSELPARLIEARNRGVHIIVIDPRRSRTARALDAEWIEIRPGTDPVFGYALLHELMRHREFDLDYVTARTEGFSTLREYVDGVADGIVKDAAWASDICGIDTSVIRHLASLWWENKPVMLLPGYSIQRIAYGEESFRLTVAIQLATRNSGMLGASSGSVNNRLTGVRVGKLREIPAGIDGSSLFIKKVPILRWSDAVLNPQAYGLQRIRALYSAGGNFLNQGADVLKNIEAFRTADFIVSHELQLTPTAMHSDVVLPVADGFEKEDIGIPWAGDYVLYKPRIVEPLYQTHTDYQIFSDLAERAGVRSIFSENRNEAQWIESFISESEIDDVHTFRRTGIFIRQQRYRAGLDEFFGDPQENPLGTRSGKIELSSPLWNKKMTEYWESEPCGVKEALGLAHFRLLTPKISEYVHSQRAAGSQQAGPGVVHIHPEDLERLEAHEGEILELRNEQGTILARVEIDLNLMRGTIWIEEGIWANPQGRVDRNGSANVLTSDEGTAESLSCVMHGIDVIARKHR